MSGSTGVIRAYWNSIFPSADSADNNNISDVIGNKADTIDGDSLLAFSKLIKSNHIIEGTSPDSGGTANTSTRIELDSDASAVDGTYDPAIINIISGTGRGQSRVIFQYDGTNKYAYINRDWKVIPDNTSVYCILMNPGDTHVNEGVAQAGSNNTLTLNELGSDQNNIYLGQIIFIVAGTGADQARMVVGYDGGTKVATIDENWIVNPDSTSIYVMLPYPGFVHGVPSTDSAANTLSRDVIGSKLDTHDGDSIYARAHTTHEHFHHQARCYPTLANGVVVLGGAAWTLGNFVEIVPVGSGEALQTNDFDIHHIIVESSNATDIYELVLYAVEVEIGRVRFVADTGIFTGGVPDVPIQTPIIPANTQIQAKLASISGGDTATISLYYHTY